MRKAIILVFMLVPLAASAAFNFDLSYGSRGFEVAELQRFLTNQQVYGGIVSGNFFSQTREAVRRFQSRFGITPTGYFGPQSRTRANALLEGSAPAAATNAPSSVSGLLERIQNLRQQLANGSLSLTSPNIANEINYLFSQINLFQQQNPPVSQTPTVIPGPSAQISANNQRFSLIIQPGTAVVLTWNSANTASCTVRPLGSFATNGSIALGNLTTPQIYNVSCLGTNGSTVTDTVSVNVNANTFVPQQQPQNPTADIKANGSDGTITVPANGTATITWSSTNVTHCTVYPQGSQATGGSQVMSNLTGSQTYTLECRGANGTSVSDTVTVKVERVVPTPRTVRVLDLQYYPVKSDGVNLDEKETGFSMTLATARSRVNDIRGAFIESIGKATTHLKDPDKVPSLRPVVHQSQEFLVPMPRSQEFQNWADYKSILHARNICGLVDNEGVREVWIWRYHHDNTIFLNESNMAIGTRSQQYWNHKTYGDISNSYQTNDLPVCENTYVVYEFNYSRGVAEALHNVGHQLERLFNAADRGLFWDRFVGTYGEKNKINNCGWIHSPPNTRLDYEWNSHVEVLSDCSDWKPDGGGATELVSCTTWNDCNENDGKGFFVWWMQRLPGRGTTLSFNGRNLRNWWELVWDFDEGVGKGFTLYE